MRSHCGFPVQLPRIVFSTALLILVVLLVSVLGTGNAQAQEPVTPRHTDPFWQASYWNNNPDSPKSNAFAQSASSPNLASRELSSS